MDELIQLVRAYQKTAELDERIQIAESIFRVVEPKMSFFVFNSVRPSAADDVLQIVLIGILKSLQKFSGATDGEFLKWCHGVARHKIHDQYHAQANERFQPLPPEEITELVDLSATVTPLAAGERLDLAYAMKLLAESKPECVEYLLKHFITGLDYGEIAEELKVNYDAARMKIGRCLETVRELVA
jgi:RNA polymerase sigma factor (sigma-70 family)